MWPNYGIWTPFVSVLMTIVLLRRGAYSQQSAAQRIRLAKEELEYVERIASSGNCSGGTDNVLQLLFDTSAWVTYTDPAIRTANFLAQILAKEGNRLDSLDDSVFYDFVRNNVHGNSLIFGSAIAIESDVHANYTIFCPYASKTDDSGGVTAFDLAKAYDYRATGTEWYYQVLIKDFSSVPVVNDTLREGNYSNVTTQLRQPVATYEHGRWTFPYYDCGGGNIWMVTYSAPILALGSDGTPVFKGVATIDLELTNIDINQCDAEIGVAAGSLDVFRGTHNCQPTTKCVHIAGQGFKRGSYQCQCRDGYYFPDPTTEIRAFIGSEIDSYFDDLRGSSDASGKFRCLKCPRGCDTCVDSTPCLFEYQPAIRIFVVLIIALLICGCGVIFFFTFKYRKQMVMKTASPIFLKIMIGAAVLMCTSVFVMYPEPTDVLCTIFVWPFHIGFSLLYGSLLIKTWRISVIFNSRKKVNLPDKVLLQRLIPVPAVMVIFLSCWTILDPPRVVTITMDDTKKFFSCSLDYWNYAVFGAEALLLLFGVYLCFTVRKAPAHFNESKHITWSTYNAIILGIFFITLTQFLAQTAGPDVVYILLMMQLHVFVTITLALIFVPKFWALHKGITIGDGTGGAMSVTGRLKPGPSTNPTTSYNVDMKHVAVQVDPRDLAPAVSTGGPTSPATPHMPHMGGIPVLPAIPNSLSLQDDTKNRSTASGLRTNKVAPLTPPPLPLPEEVNAEQAAHEPSDSHIQENSNREPSKTENSKTENGKNELSKTQFANTARNSSGPVLHLNGGGDADATENGSEETV